VRLAEVFVGALTAYTAVGLVFAIPFGLFGIHRVDQVAEHSPIGFRLIVTPGVVALWPLLLTRWLKAVSRKG
jgi:hypothetical protein